MKPMKTIRKVSSLAFVLVCAAALAACSSVGGSGKVAATVNGTKIMEDDVTAYVADFRTNNGLEDDEAWEQWMASSGMSPAMVRNQVIDYFTSNEILKQAAKEKGVTVSKADVDSQVETMKANYDSEDAWNNALSAAGTTEEKYRESVESAMLQSKLQEALAADESSEVSDEELIEALNSYSEMYNGAKRSSHILFSSDDEATAKEVLAKVNSGELDFADAAKKYSTDTASAENGGDVGWDKLSSFVTEYQDALSALEKDQVSDLVTSDYGIHIIKCTDVFNAPEEITSLDQVPSEFVDSIRDMLKSSNSSNAYSDYIAKFREDATIEINDMPEGLPYASTSLAPTEDDANAEADEAEGDSSAEESADDSAVEENAESEKEAA